MNVFIVYAHPSDDSFTRHIRDNFIKGLEYTGHNYIISDLYKMNFKSDISEGEYLREAYYRHDLPVPDDVRAEQEKINTSDALVFIYPVFWSEAPAKLVGWFDRVWTYTFAYGHDKTMKILEKGLVICSAGNSLEYFEKTGILDSMKRIMLDDRLSDRVKTKQMMVLYCTSRERSERKTLWVKHLQTAFDAGRYIDE
jgi:NAD(P)H dehydrogenase (quinone)